MTTTHHAATAAAALAKMTAPTDMDKITTLVAHHPRTHGVTLTGG